MFALLGLERRKFFGQKPKLFARPRIVYPFQWGISLSFPKAVDGPGQGQLADGRCLIFGGTDDTDFGESGLLDSYLFAADGRSYTRVGDLPFLINDSGSGGTRTTLLGDGRLLMVAGNIAGSLTATFDPTSLTWTARTSSSLTTPSGLVTLSSGNALFIDAGQGVQEYNKTSNTWSNRASTQRPHSSASTTFLPLTSEVFVCNFNGAPEVYSTADDAWFDPVNLPGNFCQTQVLLPSGKLFTATDGGNVFGTTDADVYDPVSRLFTPLPSQDNAHSSGSGGGPPLGFFLGENRLVTFSAGSAPRISWYDIGLRRWFGGGFDFNPDYTYNGEMIDEPTFVFYLGQPGATLGFLTGGHSTRNFGYFEPHAGGFYVERSQAPVNDDRVPTFNGTITVVQGLTPDRAFVTWDAGSDPLTYAGDLNYYACAVFSSGDEDWTSPVNGTEIWAGSLSMEIQGLTPSSPYFFQIAVRNMLGPNQPGTFGFQDVSAEAAFTPNTILVPLSVGSWVPTVSMDAPRSGPLGAYLSEGRYLVWGGNVDGGGPSFGGNIYSQRGTEVSISSAASAVREGASVDASPREYGVSTIILGLHRATGVGGLDPAGSTSATTNKYFPYVEGWDRLEGGDTTPGAMNEAVYRHALVQMPSGGLLRIGGATVAGDPTSTTNTVERFTLGDYTVTYFDLSSPFSVGADAIDLLTGARGRIISDTPGAFPDEGTLIIEQYSDLSFGGSDTLVDSDGGVAVVGTVSITNYSQEWAFVSSMNHRRQLHSATCLSGYSLRVDAASPMFSVGETVTGGSSGASGIVTFAYGSGVAQVLELDYVSTAFTFGEPLTGDMGGAGLQNGYDIFSSTNVLVVGGKDEFGTALTNAEIYDSTIDAWGAPITTNDTHVSFPMVTRLDRRPLALGGETATCEYYDPPSGAFVTIASLPAAKSQHTAHVFSTKHVGIFGGRSTGSSNLGDSLRSTWGVSDSDLWAAGTDSTGTNGVIYHFDGSGWTLTPWSGTPWYSVFGFATNDVWVVGGGGNTMHWDGFSWTSILTGGGADLYCVYGVGSDLWAVGQGGAIWAWNGAVWAFNSNPSSEDLHDMEGVHVGETINYVAVGNNGAIVQFTDATSAWNIIQSGLTDENLFSIVRVTSPVFSIWISGSNGTTFRATTGSFSSFSNGLGFTGDWRCIRGSDSTSVRMVGSGGEVAVFDGTSWSLQTSFTSNNLWGLWTFGASDAWAVGDEGIWFWDGTSWISEFPGEIAGVVSNVLLYDQDADTWAFKANMQQARARHVSFLMPNNCVLVIGGEDNSAGTLATAEISPSASVSP